MADITLDDLTAGRGYEHWATQSQMQSLIEQTKDIPRIAGFFQALGSTSKKETDISKAILQAARQNLQANQRGNQADAKGRAEDKRANAQANGKVNQNISKLTQITSSFMRTDGRPGGMFGLMAKGYDMIANAVGGIGQTGDAAGDATGKINKMGMAAGLVGGGLGFIAGALREMGGVVNDVTKLQERLSDRGFSVADSFMFITKESLKLGIGFNELEKVVERGRRNFAALGGNVADGTKIFLSMYSDVRDQMMDLGNLGFSSGQVIQSFQEFIDSQVTTGANMDRLASTGNATASAFTKLLKETEAVAKLTGTRREELLRNRFSVINDNAFQAQVRQVRMNEGDAAAERLIAAQGAMGTAMGSFQNTALGKQIQSMMVQAVPFAMRRGTADGAFAMTGNAELMRNLNMAGGPELIQRIRDMIQTVAQGGSEQDVMRVGTDIQGIVNSASFVNRVADLTSIPGALRQIGDGLAELGTAAERNRSFTMDNVVKAMNDTAKATSDAATETQKLNVGLGQLAISLENATGAIQSGMLDGSMTSLQNMFGGGNLNSLAENINDPGFRATLQGIGQTTGTVIGGAAAAGIAGADAIIGSIGSLANILTGGDADGGGKNLSDIDASVQELIGEFRRNPSNVRNGT